MITNPVTGEVTFTLAGKEYKLLASMKRLADYQTRLAIPGLAMITVMIKCRDARAIYEGLKCLCSSGNAADFDNMLLTPHMDTASEAISAALEAGLPELTAGDGAANPQGTAATIN